MEFVKENDITTSSQKTSPQNKWKSIAYLGFAQAWKVVEYGPRTFLKSHWILALKALEIKLLC